MPYEYSLADSISPKTWKFIDSIDLATIQKFLPKESKFEAKPTKVQFEEFKNYLQKLSKMESDRMPPCDGITICLETKSFKNKTSKKIFYSPNDLTEEGKLITKIYNIASSIFKENTKVEDAIENSQRYFNDVILKVKLTNPLYVKFLDDDCGKLENEIAKLPVSKTIFVDLTNFHKDKDECLEKIIRKKYSKIKWIVKANKNYGFAE
jgi:ubiquitin